MNSIEIRSGGPPRPRSKSRAIARSVASSALSRWAMPGGSTLARINRSLSQSRGDRPEHSAHRLQNRRQHLREHEEHAHDRERPGEVAVVAHRAHDHARGDRQQAGHRALQHEDGPPGDGLAG